MIENWLFGISTALAEAAGDAAAAAGDAAATAGDAAATAAEEVQMSPVAALLQMVLPLVLMGVVFYFMLIRPQRKKDKAVKNMLDNLKVGDRIWTIGGFYGTVAGLKDDTVTLTMGSLQNTVVVKRSAIGGVENVAVENEAAPEI